MNWDNDVHGATYPVGNVHLPYYEEVMERFMDKGLEPGDSHIVTVGSDLIGWWLKDNHPEAEVTTVEVNPQTSYLQNFAGDYLSEEEDEKSVKELRKLMGISDPSTGIPDFVEDGETPEEINDEHEKYVEKEASRFDEVPDFSKIGFAWEDFYPEILDEIGFNTTSPDNQVVGDFRYEDIPEADAVFTNNVINAVGEESFYEGLEDILKEEAYLEVVSEPGITQLRDEYGGLKAEKNPETDFWWKPSPEAEKDLEGYRTEIALYSPGI